jgi:hypothetical protein
MKKLLLVTVVLVGLAPSATAVAGPAKTAPTRAAHATSSTS